MCFLSLRGGEIINTSTTSSKTAANFQKDKVQKTHAKMYILVQIAPFQTCIIYCTVKQQNMKILLSIYFYLGLYCDISAIKV